MALGRGFHNGRDKPFSRPDRKQVMDNERGKAVLLKRIASQYDWAREEISEIRTLLADRKGETDRIQKLFKKVIERQKEINELMETVELDEETLIKAAKYDEHLAKTRKSMRRYRERKKESE